MSIGFARVDGGWIVELLSNIASPNGNCDICQLLVTESPRCLVLRVPQRGKSQIHTGGFAGDYEKQTQ